MAERPHPPARPHGELTEVLPDLFFVTGTIRLGGPVRFSRNMVVIRRGERLVLVNSVRLDPAGLAALDRLGKVTDVVRLAGFHGSDDPFYAERYGAQVWVVRGQRYTPGFDTGAEAYFTPHHEMDAGGALPVEGAQLLVIESSPPEGLLLLPEHGGVLISGDCLQNITAPDRFYSWPARIMMRLMGFMKPHNVGPAWLKRTKPPGPQLRALLEHDFANVLPAHGTPALGEARERYRPAIDQAATRTTA